MEEFKNNKIKHFYLVWLMLWGTKQLSIFQKIKGGKKIFQKILTEWGVKIICINQTQNMNIQPKNKNKPTNLNSWSPKPPQKLKPHGSV